MLNRSPYKKWPFTGPFLFSSTPKFLGIEKEHFSPTTKCCKSGCPDCPFMNDHQINPHIPAEFNDVWNNADDSDFDLDYNQEEND